MDSQPSQLSIGHPLRLRLTHACPNGKQLYADATGWHQFGAVFSNSVFRAELTLDTWINSLYSFRDELVTLNRDLKGKATLGTLEGELDLEVAVDKLGHLTWRGLLRYPASIPESTLEFTIEDDQKSLGDAIAQVNAIIAEGNSEPQPEATLEA